MIVLYIFRNVEENLFRKRREKFQLEKGVPFTTKTEIRSDFFMKYVWIYCIFPFFLDKFMRSFL